MRCFLFLFLFTSVTNIAFTQVLDPVAISGGGATFIKNDLKMTATLGQSVTGLLSISGVKLRQGFQYPWNNNPYGTDNGAAELPWSIYPNPAGDFINIQVPACNVSDFFLYLYNQYGQLLQRKAISGESALIRIDIAGYPPGVLILKFFHQGDAPISCQKIIKK